MLISAQVSIYPLRQEPLRQELRQELGVVGIGLHYQPADHLALAVVNHDPTPPPVQGRAEQPAVPRGLGGHGIRRRDRLRKGR